MAKLRVSAGGNSPKELIQRDINKRGPLLQLSPPEESGSYSISELSHPRARKLGNVATTHSSSVEGYT